jgi:hypothetical protein
MPLITRNPSYGFLSAALFASSLLATTTSPPAASLAVWAGVSMGFPQCLLGGGTALKGIRGGTAASRVQAAGSPPWVVPQAVHGLRG